MCKFLNNIDCIESYSEKWLPYIVLQKILEADVKGRRMLTCEKMQLTDLLLRKRVWVRHDGATKQETRLMRGSPVTFTKTHRTDLVGATKTDNCVSLDYADRQRGNILAPLFR